MQFESHPPVDPYVFEDGGTISGPMRFSSKVSVTRERPIADASDADNYLKFKADKVEVGKGLTVLGPLVAPNWSNNAQYPVNPTFESVTVNGNATATNLNATFKMKISNVNI